MTDEAADLNGQDILDAADGEPLPVDVPEWRKNGKPGRIYLLQVSAADALLMTKEMKNDDTKGDEGIARILAMTACDKDGKKLFTVEQVTALMKKNMKVLNRLQRIALQHNGMLPGSVALIKNDSGEAAKDASPTDSPAN
jgi:hypothetical protein